MSDEIRLGLLVVSFAALLTVHVLVIIRLFGKPQPLHGVLALVLPPVAPVFAWQRGARLLAGLWSGFAALYIVSFLLAR